MGESSFLRVAHSGGVNFPQRMSGRFFDWICFRIGRRSERAGAAPLWSRLISMTV